MTKEQADRALCHDTLRALSNPEGINQYTGAGAHAASALADKASANVEGKTGERGRQAAGDASMAHEDASKAHEAAAKAYAKAYQPTLAAIHARQADHHQQLANHYRDMAVR